MKRTLAGVLCLGLAVISVSSCQEVQGTEVVFEVWSDLQAGEVTRVHIQVVGVGEEDDPRDADYDCRVDEDYMIGADAGRSTIEFTWAVRPGDRCNKRVFLSAALYVGTMRIATGSASAEFESGQSKRTQVRIRAEDACDPGVMWCYTGCSDGAFDMQNCGWCGNSCPEGGSCQSGWCECPEEWEICDDTCVDTRNDAENCGWCGNVCDAEQACKDGECTGDCGELSRCGRSCVDTTNDRFHCGFCNNECDGGVCINSECDTSCSEPALGGQCDPIAQCGCPTGVQCEAVDFSGATPQEFCGRPTGPVAEGEMCEESSPDTFCQAGLICIRDRSGQDPMAPPPMGICDKLCLLGDGTNCNQDIGQACAKVGWQETYGVCTLPMFSESCNDVDDNLDGVVDNLEGSSDPFNCAFCGDVCPPPGICDNGGCQIDCAAGYRTTCPDGSCWDTQWDRSSCGACPRSGEVCARNAACHQGECRPGIVGDPCDDNLNCYIDAGITDGFCARNIPIGEWSIPIETGYCTKVCTRTLANCPAGSVCIEPDGLLSAGVCVQVCNPDTPEMCRQSQGFVCEIPPIVGATQHFCLPLGGGVRGTGEADGT